MGAHDSSSDAGLPLTPALPTVPLPQAHTTSAVVPTLAEPSFRQAGASKWPPAVDACERADGADEPHGLYRHAAQQLSHTNHGVNAVTGAIAFIATLGLSLLSFRYYETPFLKLKSHFSHQVHFAPPS